MIRYWLGDDKNNALVQEIDFSKIIYSSTTGSPKIIGNPLKYTGQELADGVSKDIQIEAIVIPGEGSPMTYATYIYDSSRNERCRIFIPKNITILS